MKNLLFALTLLLFTVAAQAADVVTLLSGGTRNVPASATSNYTASVNVKLSEYAGLYIAFKMTDAGTDPVLFKFAKSADGSNFETTPSVTVTVAANGTNTVKVFSSATVQGVSDFRLTQIVGSTNAALTNVTVKVFPKSSVR